MITINYIKVFVVQLPWPLLESLLWDKTIFITAGNYVHV